jgi:hypothetical protein
VIARLKQLWRGDLPLKVAFWRYAIIDGLVLNIVSTAVALAIVIAEWPVWLALCIHLLPVPYSVLACTGVWRSADRHSGRPDFPRFARTAVVAWFCFWLFF